MSYNLPRKPEVELTDEREAANEDQKALNQKVKGRKMTRTEEIEWNKYQDIIDDRDSQIDESKRFKKRLGLKADQARGHHVTDRANTNVWGNTAFDLASGRRETRDGITFSNGSAAVETDNVRNEVIQQLTATNRLAALGARIMGMDNYQVFPKVDQNPSAQHWASGDQILVDGAMQISARAMEHKTVAVMVKTDKTYLLDSGDRGKKMIGDAIEGAINEAIINSVLHGNNANKEPNGLDNISGILSIDGGGAAVTDYALHLDATAALMAKNVQSDRIGYIQGTRTWRQTAGLVGTDGQPLMAPKAIGDLRNFHTTAVLEDYGVGTDQTRLYFGDFSNLIIGLGGTFKMELAEKYADTLQTAFLVWMRYDVQVLRPDNFCIVENLATA
jgi:HK97 family phage major capsid protein